MNNREQNGQMLAKTTQIKRIDEHTYKVKSQSGSSIYDVISTELGWKCSCPDHSFRGVKCKHIFCVEFSFALRKTVESQVVISPVNIESCPQCQSVEHVVRHGTRYNKSGRIQRFFCKVCSKWFVINFGFEKIHASPKMITAALQLYFTGESLRNVRRFLELQGVNVSLMSIYRWIKKYVSLMEKYLDQITPQVGSAWRSDELYLKIKGNTRYLFALMDDSTRFWIAQQVTETKNTSDINPLFNKAKEVAKKQHNVIITDGAPNFHTAFYDEFWTRKNPKTKHIRHIRFRGDHNNNLMERMNGEVRDREKVMRGLKKDNTPILKG